MREGDPEAADFDDPVTGDGASESDMEVLTCTNARAKLGSVMARIVADRTHVIVTRRKAEPVVMVSLSDWNAMVETMHLLSTPANAVRLRESVAQLDSGRA